MSDNISAYPLAWPAGWPRARSRKPGQFLYYKRRLNVRDGIDRVLYELARLNIRRADCIISTNLRPALAGQFGEIGDPGAAVYWTDASGARKVMAIDRYTRIADNLAAIAATLEAMRAIARHGGGQVLERAFTGFAALPAPNSCWDILGMAPVDDAAAITRRFRELALESHPDIAGGSHDRMAELSRARDEAMASLGYHR